MGFDASDLRFVIVRDAARQTDHALVAVRDGQDWLILDNRNMLILNADDARQYQPLFSLNQQSIRAFASAADRVTDR
jgi:predicted transglutaminase-like cysteine proteinase